MTDHVDDPVDDPTASVDRSIDLVVEALRALTLEGDRAVPGLLDRLVAVLPPGTAAVLRRTQPTGPETVVATAGGSPAAPHLRAVGSMTALTLPLRAGGRLFGSLTVSTARPLHAAEARVAEAIAQALALAFASAAPSSDVVRVVLDAEEERAEIAAALHDSPAGSLIAARHAVDTGAGDAAVRRVVQQAMTELQAIVASLRARAIHGDLASALHQLVDDVRATGCPVELAIEPGLRHALTPARAVAAYRTVAAALEGVPGPAVVVVERSTGRLGCPMLTISVSGAADPVDAGALDRWGRRLSALDGRLDRHCDGVTVRLPLSDPITIPTPRQPPRPLASTRPTTTAGAAQ